MTDVICAPSLYLDVLNGKGKILNGHRFHLRRGPVMHLHEIETDSINVGVIAVPFFLRNLISQRVELGEQHASQLSRDLLQLFIAVLLFHLLPLLDKNTPARKRGGFFRGQDDSVTGRGLMSNGFMSIESHQNGRVSIMYHGGGCNALV